MGATFMSEDNTTDTTEPAAGNKPAAFLFENADQALYKTKEKGKCGCSFYETL